jgi:NAD(P) transhydrogenase subunit alpha
LIIGAGVVGLQAIATARRLGAIVKVIDIQTNAREAAMSLGATVAGFEVPDEIAIEKGGYAKALPPDWLKKEQEVISPRLKESDAVILSALVPGEIAPLLITRDMLLCMKPGSVIVDVSIDQGGNCAVTVPEKITTLENRLICGTKNIPGSVPVHATWLYANNIFYFVENLYKHGAVTFDTQDEIVRSTLVTLDGKILHQGTLKTLI